MNLLDPLVKTDPEIAAQLDASGKLTSGGAAHVLALVKDLAQGVHGARVRAAGARR